MSKFDKAVDKLFNIVNPILDFVLLFVVGGKTITTITDTHNLSYLTRILINISIIFGTSILLNFIHGHVASAKYIIIYFVLLILEQNFITTYAPKLFVYLQDLEANEKDK